MFKVGGVYIRAKDSHKIDRCDKKDPFWKRGFILRIGEEVNPGRGDYYFEPLGYPNYTWTCYMTKFDYENDFVEVEKSNLISLLYGDC